MRERRANSEVVRRTGFAARAAGWLAGGLATTLLAAPAMGQLGQTLSVGSYTPFPLTQRYSSSQQTITLTFNDPTEFIYAQMAPGYNYLDYWISNNQCTAGNYAAGATCTITVNFSPQFPGWSSAPAPIARTAPLQLEVYDFTTNYFGVINLPLTGTGSGPQAVVSPGTITDLIGTDSPAQSGYAGDGGPAAKALFTTPAAIAMDVLGNIYIADTGNNVIRMYYQAGNFPTLPNNPVAGNVYTIAGIGPTGGVSNGGAGTDNVLATQSALNGPTGVAVDALGNLYISDSNNQAVRMVSAQTGYITTIAGTLNSPETPGSSFSGDLGPATQAQLYFPAQIAVDGNLNVYIADSGNNALRVVYMGGTALANLIATEIPGTTAVAGNIYTIAGGPGNTAQPGNGDGGLATAGNLNFPTGVTVDSIGDVYIADNGDNAVRRVDATTGNLSTVYPGTDNPVNLAVDMSDNIYFTLQHSCTIQQYNPSQQLNMPTPYTSVMVGNGVCAASGDNGPSTLAGLSGAEAVVVNGAGNIYALEADGVRQVASAAITYNFGNVNVGTAAVSIPYIVTDADVLPYGNTVYATGGTYFSINPQGPPFSTVPYAGLNTNIFDCNAANYSLAPGQSCGTLFQYSPIADGGPQTAQASNQMGLALQLSGTGTGPLPTATLTGGPLNFQAIAQEGASTAQTLVLTNTSAVALTLTNIYFSSFDFQEKDTCGISNYVAYPTLAPGASCNINVTFAASTTGNVSGTIYVADNASSGGGTQTATVNGTAIAPLGVFSPTELVSGIVTPGGTQNLVGTLTNSGSATLHINPQGFSVTGNNPGQFVIVGNTCGATLAISASCQITVQYTPLTFAYYSADLNVQDDSGGARIVHDAAPNTYLWNTQLLHMVGLTGNPLEAASFTLGNATFPTTAVGQTSASQTVTLTLNSAVALQSISMTSGFTEFAVGTITGCVMDGVTVNPSGTVCQIPMTFAPLWPGTRNAPLSVIDVESGVPLPYAFGLTGTGTGPVAAISPGVINTVVGSAHGVADGITFADGPAVDAQVGFTVGYARDSIGNQFIADEENNVIWKVDTGGSIHLYAGTPFPPGGYLQAIRGDGGTALGSAIGFGGPLALDSKDGLYLADNNGNNYGVANEIRYIDAVSGLITDAVGFTSPGTWNASTGYGVTLRIVVTVSGTHYVFVAARGGTSGTQQPTWPKSLGATVADGSIIWSNQGVYFGGSGCAGQTDAYGDGCVASQALVGAVGGIVVDSANNVYFSDSTAERIRRVDAVTKIVTSIAGTGTAAYQGDGGLATAASVQNPTDLTFDSNGNLYFIDGNGYIIREINMSTGIISTVAGKQIYSAIYEQCGGGGGDGGLASAANFAYLSSIAIDAANDIYVTDTSACSVRRIDGGTNIIHTVAGVPYSYYYNNGYGDVGQFYGLGSATQSVLAEPAFIRLDGNANMFIASAFGGVREVNVAQGILTFNGSNYSTYSPNQQQIDTVSTPLTATVLNAGNSGTVDFLTPFNAGPNWGISTEDFIRDVTSPTGVPDCYNQQSIAVGYTCPINVDFTPQSGTGLLTAFNTVNDNVNDETFGAQPIELIGYSYGTPPQLTLTPPLLSFSTQQGTISYEQTLTLTNNGITPVNLSSIAITGSGAFQQNNDCTPVLANGASCAIFVTFSPPLVTGIVVAAPPLDVLTGTVVVTDAASNSPQTSQLVGVGTTGGVGVGGFLPTVQETAHFTDTVTIVPSTLLNISETVHFTDSLPGLISPTVNINVNEAIAVNDADQALLPIVINDMEAISVSDTDKVYFPVVIADNEAITVSDGDKVYFPIVISDNEKITVADAPAAATTAGILAVSPNTLTFGSVPDGTTSGPLVVTITNSTAATVSFNSFTISAGSPYSVAAKTCGATLAAGAICTVSVQFSPQSASVWNGTLTVADSAATSPQVVQLTGSGATYALTVTPRSTSRNFNTANPAFQYDITGFVNGDTSAVVSGSPVLTTTATLNSLAGMYPISATLGTLTAPSQYGFTFATGTLTVNGNAAQTIYFPHIPNIPLASVHQLSLTAHSTSGLPITYTVTGPATLVGTTLHLTGTGLVTVTAKQAGNSTFAAAPNVQRSFTVTP